MIDKALQNMAILAYKQFLKISKINLPIAYYRAHKILKLLQRAAGILILISGLVVIMFTTIAFKTDTKEGMEAFGPAMKMVQVLLDVYFIIVIIKLHRVILLIKKMIGKIEKIHGERI